MMRATWWTRLTMRIRTIALTAMVTRGDNSILTTTGRTRSTWLWSRWTISGKKVWALRASTCSTSNQRFLSGWVAKSPKINPPSASSSLARPLEVSAPKASAGAKISLSRSPIKGLSLRFSSQLSPPGRPSKDKALMKTTPSQKRARATPAQKNLSLMTRAHPRRPRPMQKATLTPICQPRKRRRLQGTSQSHSGSISEILWVMR